MAVQANDRAEVAARIARLEDIAGGFSEAAAWVRGADGAWSLMEILSHLLGDPEETRLAGIHRGLAETTPTLLGEPGETGLSGRRLAMGRWEAVNELAAMVRTMDELQASLDTDQAERTVRIPWLAGSPLGETPSVGVWLDVLLSTHLDDHIAQMEALRTEVKSRDQQIARARA